LPSRKIARDRLAWMQAAGRKLAAEPWRRRDPMHTKNGRALQTSGSTLYTGSGQVVGRLRESRLFDQDGRYVGTVVGDRLVYRAAERSKVGPAFTAARCPPRALQDRARVAMLRGDEPTLPD
jgi:hypothetical protein